MQRLSRTLSLPVCGKLRLVPVLSRAWGTRTAKKTAYGLQGLWVTDNSYGCIELRIDDFGDGRGMWGVHESKSLETPVFTRDPGRLGAEETLAFLDHVLRIPCGHSLQFLL